MNPPGRRTLLAGLFALCFTLAAARDTSARDEAAAKMAKAANAFLDGLDKDQRARASFAFDSPVRLDWHYVPRERQGLAIGDLDAENRARFDALLDCGFSKPGHAKFDDVRKLEAVLREKESKPGAPATMRDPAKYHVAIFGKPGVDPWSWRVEGHHFSAHFTSVDNDVISVTPNFVGANPAIVELSEPQPLESEESRAGVLIAMLQFDSDYCARARLPGKVPQDVLLDPSTSRLDGKPAGIRASDLTPMKRAALLAIVDGYFADLSTELAARERARFARQSFEELYFAWAGESKDAPLYWRVQGSYFAIEFVYPRGDINHAHRIWRDFERDLGGDPLREHLSKEK